jgi:uroporphyrinogen decarboxylase
VGDDKLLSERENYIRNARFQKPEWIPAAIHINNASWDLWREELEKVALKYPEFFPYVKKGWRDYDNFNFGNAYTKGVPFKDSWGCTWETVTNGIEGIVTKSPLLNWDDFKNYKIPDGEFEADREPRNWPLEQEIITQQRIEGRLTSGSLPHGFLFLRLQYLRGFENSLIDILTEEPLIEELILKIYQHNEKIVKRYVDMNVDIMEFPEDLGMQNSLVISPNSFKKQILPSYKKLFEICKRKNTLIGFHSDGYIMEIVGDLIEAGVDIINPQDLCNGIDNIAKEIKGRACIRLDIDRQKVIPYGTRKDIFELIEEEIRKLGSVQGGLEFIVGIYPPTPPENVDALCAAIKKYQRFWWE